MTGSGGAARRLFAFGNLATYRQDKLTAVFAA